MKTLTIKEPWATLIIEGYKKYEFRSWKTNYRGKILIHTSKLLEKNILKRFDEYNLDCKCGYIIGEAHIVDCIKVDENFNNELLKLNNLVYGVSNHVGIYAWKLEYIKKYDKPIPCNGKLGLWNYEGMIKRNIK